MVQKRRPPLKYTQFSRVADNVIEGHLNIICGEIEKRIPGVVSIILMGGFAKGEGSVKAVGKKIEPLNDYDLYVITERRVADSLVEETANACAQRIGKAGIPFDKFDVFYKFDKNFFVDLHTLTLNSLPKLPPLVRYYELRNCGLTLRGKGVLGQIPRIRADEIPPSEGIRFIFNRMTNLIMYFSPAYRQKLPPDTETLVYFTTRAILTAGTALLIKSGKFEMGYRDALNRLKATFKRDFPEMAKKFPRFLQDLEMSTSWKLNPYSVKAEDPVKLWYRACDYLEAAAELYLTGMLKRKIDSPRKASSAMLKELRRVYYSPYLQHMLKQKGVPPGAEIVLPFAKNYLNLRFFVKMAGRGKFLPQMLLSPTPPDLCIFAAAPLIIGAAGGKVDSGMLREAEAILATVHDVKKTSLKGAKHWEKVAKDYSDAYSLFFYQKIV